MNTEHHKADWLAAIERGETTDGLQAFTAARIGAERAEKLADPETMKEWRVPIIVHSQEWARGQATVIARNAEEAAAKVAAGEYSDWDLGKTVEIDTLSVEVDEDDEADLIGLAGS